MVIHFLWDIQRLDSRCVMQLIMSISISMVSLIYLRSCPIKNLPKTPRPRSPCRGISLQTARRRYRVAYDIVAQNIPTLKLYLSTGVVEGRIRLRRLRRRKYPGLMDRPAGNSIYRFLRRSSCRMDGATQLRHCSCCHIYKVML